ncbi:MAG: MFS transporter [Xanthobacteraceae bacterium]|nr:MAG: MFS transporter [Xanthobacteraceae bacterium]HMN51694.1 MFS transporter [Xanthobacteraceae bacterium]
MSPLPEKHAGRIALAVVILLISLNLRPSITAVGPLIEYVRHDLKLSGALAGLLTTMPLLAFAFVSPWAPAIGRRLGMERAIFLALLLLSAGILLRSAPPVFALYAGAALLAGAIAIGNVLVPALIKRDFPDKIGVMTSVFATSMAVSGSLSAGIAVPIADTIYGGWRGSMAVWFAPAILTALFLLPRLRRAPPSPATAEAQVKHNVWRSKLAWQVTAFMGLQSMSFYVMLTWLPSILQGQGMSAANAGWMLAIFTALGIAVGFVLPPLMARLNDQRMLAAGASVLMMSGYAGMIFFPALTLLWALIVGVAVGTSFLLALSFFSLRAANAQQAAALSGMAQSVGYSVAAAGPVVFGALHDLTQGWRVPLAMVVVTSAVQTFLAWRAGRKAHVGDSSDTRL